MTPAVGSVCLATGKHAPRRLVLVFATPELDFVQVALAHSFMEFATDQDLLLSPAATGLPYLLVVQTDLVSPLLTRQLSLPLATLPLSVAHACYPGASLATYARGLPLQGRSDARWNWKLSELEALHALGQRAMRRLLD